MNTIKDSYRQYRDMVVPEGAGKEQILQTRRAFYAGATSALSLLIGIGRDSVSGKDVGPQLVQSLLDECTDFLDTTLQEVIQKDNMVTTSRGEKEVEAMKDSMVEKIEGGRRVTEEEMEDARKNSTVGKVQAPKPWPESAEHERDPEPATLASLAQEPNTDFGGRDEHGDDAVKD